MNVMATIFLLPWLLAHPAVGDDDSVRKVDDFRSQAEALVRPLLDKKQSVGVVVGVIEAGRTHVWGFGREALGGDKTPDGKTIFEIGSVTKVFTSLALAQMAQESLVRLDDPVERCLPAGVKVASRSGREITLEDLATHTSGMPRIPLNLVFLGVKSNDPYAGYKDKDLYDFLKVWKPTADIGTKWAYSNVGVGLLGHALARRAGVAYGQLIADRIAEPLGMKDTRITLGEEQERRLAKPYALGNTPSARWTFNVLAGCGALYSTADDLLDFLTAELGIKDSKLRAAMEVTQQPRRETGISGMRMSLGWIVKKLPKQEGEFDLYWHNGGTAGYSSFVGFIRERKTAVVVLTNTGPSMGSFGAVDSVGAGVLKIDRKLPR
jgi:D-alanyl-D-alanine-carboxypeptidase/D-alanyl-D-alanine-endopeptidase